MVMLLALPVLLVVTRAHRYLQVYAPSNLLIRRVQMSRPRLRTCAMLVVLTAGLLGAMKIVANAVAAGAPGWLNLVVLVLAWDAIKVGWCSSAVGMARLRQGAGRATANWRKAKQVLQRSPALDGCQRPRLSCEPSMKRYEDEHVPRRGTGREGHRG